MHRSLRYGKAILLELGGRTGSAQCIVATCDVELLDATRIRTGWDDRNDLVVEL
jgi:hypothetical protein